MVPRRFLQYFKKSRQKGQSLVEMSVGFVVLLFILSGILDFGRAYFAYIALTDAVAEATLYLSIDPDCYSTADTDLSLTPPRNCADPNNAVFRAANAAGGNLAWSNAFIELGERPAAGLRCVGEQVGVNMRYNFRVITPFVSRITPTITLYANARQIIISEPEGTTTCA